MWVSFYRQWRSKTGSRKKRVSVVAISSLPFVSSGTVWALSQQHFDNLFSLPKCIKAESFSFKHSTYTSFWLPPFRSMHRQWSAFADVWVKPCMLPLRKMNMISLWRHVSPSIDYKNNNGTSWDRECQRAAWKAGMHEVSTPSMLNSFHQCNSGF